MKKFAGMVVAAVLSFMCLKIVSAEEADIKLQEVVVTATKTEKDPKDVTQSVTVITADEIKKSGATTVEEVVAGTVGTFVNNYGPKGGLNVASLRGSEFAQTLVLLDGIRLNLPRDGGFSLSDLPISLDNIERIEIVRGPSSALYGADAVGGVVNIITKKPEKSQTNINAAVGSRGYDSVSLVQSGRAEKFYYALSAVRDTSDGFRVNSDLDEKKLGLKLGYDFSKDSGLELSSNYIDKEVGTPGPEEPTFLVTPFARQMTKDTVTGLGYRLTITPELDLKVNVTCHRDKLVYQDPQNSIDSTHRSITRGADVQANWLIGSWNMLTAGAEVRRDYVRSTDTGEHAASLVAGFIQDELSFGKSIILVLGGRGDSHSVYGGEFSPKASARYLISGSGTILRASYGEAFRAPTFNDLYWSDAWGNIGNPDLRPERSKEYEAGIEQSLGTAFTLKVTGFDRKVRDLIDWQEYAPFQYTPVNIGRAKIRGREGEAALSLSRYVTVAASYTYMKPIDETTGQRIYYTIPKSQTKGSVIFSLPSKTTVSFEGRAVENYVKPGESDWKYSVFDGKITQTVLARSESRGEVFFGIKNAFDRKFESVRNYPMPPREIYGGVSVQF